MRQYLLYVMAPSRLADITSALERLKAKRIPDDGPLTQNFDLDHRLLKGMTLRVHLLADLDGVSPFLRQHPVDLLVYDERGIDSVEAVTAVQHISRDVTALAQLWGPDFHFPNSRIITVLKNTQDIDHRVFALGRLNVRDVIIDPSKTALVLRWLRDVLYAGILRENKVGLALSGGAIEGLLYQAGTMLALKHAFENRSVYDCDVISGISSGSIVGSIVANQIEIEELIRGVLDMPSRYPALRLSTIFDLAGLNIIKRMISSSLKMRHMKLNQWLETTLESIPTGFFKGDKLEAYFHELFVDHGVSDEFSDIKPKLYIGATDQDSFEHVTLGRAPNDKLHISAAVRASCSLPPLFTPKAIDDRWYIDGQVTKSCNLESVVEEGTRLIFVIDPMKPYKATVAGSSDTKGGYYGIVQMIKALVSTRFDESLRSTAEQFPDVDFIVFQPDEECARLMAGSPLRARLRTEVIEVAYQSTLRRLRERHRVYAAKTGRYGFELKSIEALRKLETSYYELIEANSY
ncbi:MAG: patatin-like phospholipase family protein [Proteobacteria bacterium]|nr:patatin-like phospholipase family protein [Pseudomonadota bacterium]